MQNLRSTRHYTSVVVTYLTAGFVSGGPAAPVGNATSRAQSEHHQLLMARDRMNLASVLRSLSSHVLRQSVIANLTPMRFDRFVSELRTCKRLLFRQFTTLRLLLSDMTGACKDVDACRNNLNLTYLQDDLMWLQAKRAGKICCHEFPTAQPHRTDGSVNGALCCASQGDRIQVNKSCRGMRDMSNM